MELNKDAIRLIDRLYKDLYLNNQVLHHGSGNKYDKFNNIASYLSKLESTHDKISTSNRHIEYLKKCYYDRYVIKKEDIPESYYKNQEQMALDRGFGHININNDQKTQLQNEVIENQKKSLDTWIDYFLSDDAKVYPFWAKYWAFQGMLNLGYFDKEKNKFYKRNKNTIYPFCDLNREALAMSIDLLIKGLNKEIIDDKDLEILVKSGSFQKIYTYILTRALHDNKNITKRNTGKWVKYVQGSDHMPLVNSLKGYNTGWCTAGESTAESQLQGGDFYVYYTLDDNDEYKVPRIAIRMENGSIGEIRGVAKDQNIEPDMEKVVEEKLNEFPDKDMYYKKVNDMKSLTAIYNKALKGLNLTKEELIFLYEINDKIGGFGYKKDPRIEEITDSRNMKKDLSQVFDCKEEQIALNQQELNFKDDIIYLHGDLSLLNGLTYVDEYDLKFPKRIRGEFKLNSLLSAEGLNLPEHVDDYLFLDSLKSAKGLVLPKYIHSLLLDGLNSAEGLCLPDRIDGELCLKGLKSAKGLVLPKYIGEALDLSGLESAIDLILPERIDGALYLDGIKSEKYLKLPIYIGDDLDLKGLNNAKDLILPDYIGGMLILGIKNIEGLGFPKYMFSLRLTGLEEIECFEFKENIEGNLEIFNLKKAKKLILPERIGSILDLSSLETIEELILPKSVGFFINLKSLKDVKRLVLPEYLSGDLYLTSLDSIKSLVFPEKLTYTIYMDGFDITPDNVDEYRNKQKAYKR